MADCKPISVPLDQNGKVSADVGVMLEDPTMYRKMVGSLIYATISRPVLSYVVGLVSQFMQATHKSHLDCVRCIMRYLSTTMDYALFYAADTTLELCGYTNADWAGSTYDRRSTSVVTCFLLGVLLLLGAARSNLQLLYLAQRLSIVELQWLHVR